jgi:hypothetical protein
MVAGAINGTMSSLVVLYQYLTRPDMRIYPNPLLIRQTLADMFLATVVSTCLVLCGASTTPQRACVHPPQNNNNNKKL